ncbi:MAG: carboxylesterase family protein, partial [Clostridia bacterium]|nr:carboxylesterase family protein [Clostridia bacterium]
IPCPVSKAIETRLLHNIPYILCSTGQDLWQPELYHAILKWEDEAEAQGIGPCYAAHFSRHLPGDDRGAFHSADLWYWCGTLQNSWRPNTDWDRELSRRMAAYLTNFAKTGDPNGENFPLWQTHGEAPDKIMVFSDETATQQNSESIM